MHLRGDVHETLEIVPSTPRPDGRPRNGTRSTAHRRPFQRSMSGPMRSGPPTSSPPATHHVAEMQEMLSNRSSVPPGESPRSDVQPCPFQWAAPSPTAKHDSAETQDTLSMSPEGGRATTVHARPFQRSARPACSFPVIGVVRAPTARQAVRDTHDTPASSPGTAAAFVGVVIRQRDPFQTSASVADDNALSVKDPTATQCRRDVHDTAVSCPLAIGGAGTA